MGVRAPFSISNLDLYSRRRIHYFHEFHFLFFWTGGVGIRVQKKKMQLCPWGNIQMILTPRSQKLGASFLQVLSEKCTQSPGGCSSERKPQFLPEYFSWSSSFYLENGCLNFQQLKQPRVSYCTLIHPLPLGFII